MRSFLDSWWNRYQHSVSKLFRHAHEGIYSGGKILILSFCTSKFHGPVPVPLLNFIVEITSINLCWILSLYMMSNFFFFTHCNCSTGICPRILLSVWKFDVVWQFLVQLSAKIGVGVHYDQNKQLGYTLRGKKSFPLTSNGLVGINFKGLLLTDQEYNVVSLLLIINL